MMTFSRYKLLDEIEEEYSIFIENLSGLADSTYDLSFDNVDITPKKLMMRQIDMLTVCCTQKEINKNIQDIDYSYEELKYIYSLTHLNFMRWFENVSEDVMILEEYSIGTYDSFEDWFKLKMIKELKEHNEKMDQWRIEYDKKKKNL